MKEVGAFEAKNTLSALLDLVEQGEEVVITRHGREVARLVPPKGAFNRDDARRAAEELRAMRRDVGLDAAAIKTMIEDGRP